MDAWQLLSNIESSHANLKLLKTALRYSPTSYLSLLQMVMAGKGTMVAGYEKVSMTTSECENGRSLVVLFVALSCMTCGMLNPICDTFIKHDGCQNEAEDGHDKPE